MPRGFDIPLEQLEAGREAEEDRLNRLARGELCADCPPIDYPTDRTRCLECPRRTVSATEGRR